MKLAKSHLFLDMKGSFSIDLRKYFKSPEPKMITEVRYFLLFLSCMSFMKAIKKVNKVGNLENTSKFFNAIFSCFSSQTQKSCSNEKRTLVLFKVFIFFIYLPRHDISSGFFPLLAVLSLPITTKVLFFPSLQNIQFFSRERHICYIRKI